MAAGRLIFPGMMPAEDANGDRIAGAKAYFYVDGSTTLADVYDDSDLVTPLANPVVADGVGTWPEMWADTATLFTVALTDGDGVPLPFGAWSGLSAAIDATLASVALALAAQTAAETAQAAAEFAELQAEAAAATVTGAPFSGTSSTPMTVGTGSKTFELDQDPAEELFYEGQSIAVAITGSATNRMVGIITDIDAVTNEITFLCASTGGAGTASAWTVSLAAEAGVASLAGLTGIVTAAAAKAALAITTADISDFNAEVNKRAISYAIAL